MGLSTFEERVPFYQATAFTSADTTVAKQAAKLTTSPVRIDSILATNTDTIPHVIRLTLVVSSVNYLIGSVSVPAGAGTLGTPSVDALAGSLPVTQAGIVLDPLNSINAAMEVAVAATFAVTLVALGGSV